MRRVRLLGVGRTLVCIRMMISLACSAEAARLMMLGWLVQALKRLLSPCLA